MSRPYCAACGTEAGGNYCPNCGTSLDKDTQRHVSALYEYNSEKQQRRHYAEVLKLYAETAEERSTLETIKERI